MGAIAVPSVNDPKFSLMGLQKPISVDYLSDQFSDVQVTRWLHLSLYSEYLAA
jgi:hypothetical protein